MEALAGLFAFMFLCGIGAGLIATLGALMGGDRNICGPVIAISLGAILISSLLLEWVTK